MSTSLRARAVLLGALLMIAAACGNAATATLVPSAPAVATPAPSASASPTAVPTETPAPSAPVEGGGPIAEAAVAKLQSDPLIAHVEQVGTITTSGQDFTYLSTSDFAGDDLHVAFSITGGGETSAQELYVIGDDAWVRAAADDPFTKVATTALGTAVDELYKAVRLVDDPQALRFVGVETIDGQELQHLRAVVAIPYTPPTGGTGQYDAFDLWVLEDGTPVVARTEFSATDPTGLDATGATDFTFSKWGGPITIEPPAGS